MANKVQIRRGNFADLPALSSGEPALTTDTKQVFIGTPDGNVELRTAPAGSALSVYVATSALGGRNSATQGATGLQLATGTNTTYSPSRLIDANANFSASLAGKTVYNATDDTWAKVNSVDSATQLTLSTNAFGNTGKTYAVCDAIDNIPEAFSKVTEGFKSNQTIRISPGAFADDITFTGKTAGGDYSLTVYGSTTGTTAISGKCAFRQKLTLRSLTLTGKLYAWFGADLSWYNCTTSGGSRLYVYTGSANYFNTCTVTFGNDPREYTAISSTITKGYTMYAAPASLGGDDSVADGLAIHSGSATSATANKLIDNSANFGTDVLGKTVYNSTDDTWAKVTARDSSTQLSLSADIMASGEAYVISNAFATVNAALAAVPGVFNCDTAIKLPDGIFSENVVIRGKNPSGNFTLTLEGTSALLDSLTAASGAQGTGATQGTVVRNAGTWTANQRDNKFVKFTSGNNNGVSRIVDSNDTTTITIAGCWAGPISAGDTFRVFDWATVIDGSTAGPAVKLAGGQRAVRFKKLKFVNAATAYPDYEPFYMDVGSQAEFYNCWFYPDDSAFGLYQEPYSRSFIYESFLGGSDSRGMWVNTAASDIWQSKFYNATAGNAMVGIRASQGGKISVSRGTIIDNFDSASGGCYADQNSLLIFYTATADGYNRVRNCGIYGINGTDGSRIKFNTTSYVAYSGNGTNTNVDATSSKDY